MHRGIRVIVTGRVPGRDGTTTPTASHSQRYPRPEFRASFSVVNQPDHGPRDIPAAEPVFCDATGCHGLIGGVVVYFDTHHIPETYSRSLAPYLALYLGARLNAVLARTLPPVVH